MIAILDYGVGNVGSILNMLKRIGVEACLASRPEEIKRADKFILPGIGSFDDGMRRLRCSGLLPAIEEQVLFKKKPILGICLGAQMITKRSEEGLCEGLGWIDAETIKFKLNDEVYRHPLPNIGWREVHATQRSPLIDNLPTIKRFYFVHSYHMVAEIDREEIVFMTTNYGYEYACGISDKNVYCVQFHPEKSHRFGMKFLKNFSEIT